jgi:hypothetical protein
MKKILFIILSIFSLSAQAQQQQQVLKNKRGIMILPQRGNYCIGISANPFFTYFGNMFNNSTTSNSPAFTFANTDQTIFGKYMKTNNMAYRANFRIGISNTNYVYNVLDLSPGAAQNATVSDLFKRRGKNIGLSFGVEKRKGNTRMQGVYGVEGFISFASGNDRYEYGNKLENLDTGYRRLTEFSLSNSLSIGFRGFAGVEYFIAPNISIGGELGYGPNFTLNSAPKQSIEQYDFAKGTAIIETKEVNPKTQSISLDTDNSKGVIKLLFYF